MFIGYLILSFFTFKLLKAVVKIIKNDIQGRKNHSGSMSYYDSNDPVHKELERLREYNAWVREFQAEEEIRRRYERQTQNLCETGNDYYYMDF